MSSKIGSDPEFMVVKPDGEGISAREVPLLHENWDQNKPLGSDGDNGELRPAAAVSTDDHVDNIAALLFKFGRRTNYGIKAGSSGGLKVRDWDGNIEADHRPLGGHIHFDMPRDEDNRVPDWDDFSYAGEDLESTNPLGRRLKMLDLYLALPVRLIDDGREFNNRLEDGDYGYLSDIRTGDRTGVVEYRTLPSWLVSREWSRRVLTLGRTIWDLADLKLNRRGWSDVWEGLQKGWAHELERRQLMSLYKKHCLPYWMKLIERAPELKPFLDPWMQMIAENKRWTFKDDALEHWPTVRHLGENVDLARGRFKVEREKVNAVRQSISPPKRPCVLYQLHPGEGDEVVRSEGGEGVKPLVNVVKKELRDALMVGLNENPSAMAQKKLERMLRRV